MVFNAMILFDQEKTLADIGLSENSVTKLPLHL